MELNKLFEGMVERYQNLVLFLPIYQLNQSTDSRYKDLDLMEVGFSVLMFILEKMLTEKGRVTNEQLNQYLGQLMKEVYDIEYTYEEINELRTYLVDKKLRNDGKDFIYEFMDYQKKEKRYIQFKLIESDNWTYANHINKEIYLRLTEKGIELLFKTKEIFSEMQISITMLYFKQQLEKGAFSEVLSIAKDLLFQIDSQIRSIEDYGGKIKRNVLSVFNRKEMEDRLQRSYDQTKEERKQIQDLQGNIDRVKNNYANGMLSKKEEKKYTTILEIDRLLTRSIARHGILYAKKFELLSTLTNSIQLLIENAFSKHFNFEQEIIQNWIEKKVTDVKVWQILKPIMPLKINKVFNPLRAFRPQLIKKIGQEKDEEIMLLDEEESEHQKLENERKEVEEFRREKEMMKMILYPLLEKERYFISDVLKPFRKEDFKGYARFEEENLQYILDISIKLHQNTYKKFELVSEEELVYDSWENKMLCEITRDQKELIEIEEFEMFETERVYEFLDGTIMTDYIIQRKD